MNRPRRNDSFFGLANSNAPNDFVVVGVPWDVTSSYRRGGAEAPEAIRVATSGRLYNRFTERGADLASRWKVCDHGNIARTNDFSTLKERLASALNRHDHNGAPTLFLGGDHFVTYPCFSLIAEKLRTRVSLLYFDAHPDLYERYEGESLSHATVVSRILDDADLSSGTVCYVGIRASTREQDERIRKLGLTALTAEGVCGKKLRAITSSIRSSFGREPIYLSVDLDCLDSAFAPGVGNPQPGGLSTRQILEILHSLRGLRIVAADVVEYCPRFDSGTATAFTAAIVIKEMMGLIETL